MFLMSSIESFLSTPASRCSKTSLTTIPKSKAVLAFRERHQTCCFGYFPLVDHSAAAAATADVLPAPATPETIETPFVIASASSTVSTVSKTF